MVAVLPVDVDDEADSAIGDDLAAPPFIGMPAPGLRARRRRRERVARRPQPPSAGPLLDRGARRQPWPSHRSSSAMPCSLIRNCAQSFGRASSARRASSIVPPSASKVISARSFIRSRSRSSPGVSQKDTFSVVQDARLEPGEDIVGIGGRGVSRGHHARRRASEPPAVRTSTCSRAKAPASSSPFASAPSRNATRPP